MRRQSLRVCLRTSPPLRLSPPLALRFSRRRPTWRHSQLAICRQQSRRPLARATRRPTSPSTHRRPRTRPRLRLSRVLRWPGSTWRRTLALWRRQWRQQTHQRRLSTPVSRLRTRRAFCRPPPSHCLRWSTSLCPPPRRPLSTSLRPQLSPSCRPPTTDRPPPLCLWPPHRRSDLSSPTTNFSLPTLHRQPQLNWLRQSQQPRFSLLSRWSQPRQTPTCQRRRRSSTQSSRR
mmetsp:Transcript_15374/g.26481  ORF Transcript_15374/g.26481 Transcript_15374/m.26481 type:complete len:232 (+) Transcript_15374:432-1127(+)